jgi:type II secretion system protein G
MPKRRAFTLIELLIVVAIIAILAAIAVPNFLEAQTRSKVSKAQAGLATLRTGLEAYAVDWNHYPTHRDQPNDLAALTTPMSFLATIPTDPFTHAKATEYHIHGDYLAYEDLVDVERIIGPNWGGPGWIVATLAQGRKYALYSFAPDREANMGSLALAYDPTNGTVSSGDTFRLGP